MAQFRFLPIPIEDYDALEISEDSILETYLTDEGALVVRKVSEEDLNDFLSGEDDF